MSLSSKFELKLHEALAADFGIMVDVTGDRALARQKFYAARSKNLLLFESISVVFDPLVSNRLWLIKKGGPSAEDS